MDLEKLLQGLGAAVLDDGGRISATEARRIACEAGIIPAVLGGKGQPLDVGRKKRFHTEPQRIAMAIRDGGCTAEGCDYPPGLCHAHHDIAWGRNGDTNVKDGRLLCPRHHAFAHNPRYETTRLGTGKLRFTRRSEETGRMPPPIRSRAVSSTPGSTDRQAHTHRRRADQLAPTPPS